MPTKTEEPEDETQQGPRPHLSQEPSVSSDRVEIMVSQATYQSGEEVEFTIANRLDRRIYYTYGGCVWPTIYRVEDGHRIGVAVVIAEVDPPVEELAPGEARVCEWDQTAWQDPDKVGQARFRSYIERTEVPLGQYQFALDYFLSRSDVHSLDMAETVYSQVFTIGGR
jgi:hypothetical protein